MKALVLRFAAIVFAALLTGCAALPMPLQPEHMDYNSNAAEITWLALDAVDTAQTMHIRRSNPACAYEADPVAAALYGSRDPSPGRVLVTNIALAAVHASVTSWLDDKVAVEDAQREADDDYGIGPWMATRFLWLSVSLIGSAHSVVNNYQRGCGL